MLYRYSKDKKGRPIKSAVIYTKEEHKIAPEKIDRNAYWIVKRLREEGFDAYIVGGAVRDLIAGKKEPKDFDITTSATPSRIKKIFRNSRIIGRRFRLVHVMCGETIYEVSTFRSIKDGSVGNSFGTIDEDVQRRDFTLNALYYDPLKEHVIDYVGGYNDIKKGIVKPVIPMDRIFTEDPVRMLRAIKYGTTTGCRLPYSLKRKIRKSAHLLLPVSPSRLTEELLKIINGGHSSEIVRAAIDYDLYMYMQPQASALIYGDKSFEQKYFSHLKELDKFVKEHPESRLGQRLYFVVYDFIATLTDWKAEIESSTAAGELFSKTWSQVRNFVLPMNPQRTELEFAIKKVLQDLGVKVRSSKKRKKSSVNS